MHQLRYSSSWRTQGCQLLVLVKMPWQTVSLSLVVSCLETIATFLFVLVIMTVTSESKGNGAIAGLVIGLSLMAMILVGLNITGLSVNPARSLAPAVLVGGAALRQVWIFILAPIVGGILAALVAKNFLGTEE